jgi:hypothetical protein
MSLPRWRERTADALGLLALLLLLLDYLRPSLLLLPTIAAGGDTPCHYPTAVWFHERLLPSLRLHGWYPGAYLGQPLLLYYFPLPFLIISSLAPLTGMPVAFKLGTVLGVFLLPLLSYAALRLMGFGFPAPLLGAAGALVFLFLEENPIWGGSLASTLTGEFAYTLGIGLAVLFLGGTYRCFADGRGPWVPAVLLALTALAHGYAVLWAGLSASFFLYAARRPARTLRWLVALAGLAFALAGTTLVPLLFYWRWTTPYDDPWITVTTRGLFPALLWPLFVFAVAGLLRTLLWARRTGGPDHRLLYLIHAAAVGAALAAAGPALGIIDVRFVPFAHLALCLAGGAALGLVLRRLAAPDLAALGFLVLALWHADNQSKVLRSWIDWNYTGLEAKELWPAFSELSDRLRGTVADPRVAVEYSPTHEKAGSIRMYETLPFFTGRSTLEGVYNQASLQTHAVYYLASELFATSPNPFRSREYSHFDPENAFPRLRLFNVNEIVALSPQLISTLDTRADVMSVASIPPYRVFHLASSGSSYVEPLRFAPVRSSPAHWRDKAYRWFTRKPLSPAPLVFTDDPRIAVVERDEWLAPPLVPLAEGVKVEETVEAEGLTITTNTPGHPLLVKVSYHPRWRAEGADGPYLVSPALMMVIPRQRTVRLVYPSRNAADWLGLGLSGIALGVVAAGMRRRRPVSESRPAPGPVQGAEACALPPPGRRWGGLVPGGLVLLLVASRFVSGPRHPAGDATTLYERASQAYAAGAFEEAAEYARHGAGFAPGGSPLRAELLCLRGESLARAGHPREAAEAFSGLVLEAPTSPYVAQALFGGAAAREAAGDAEGAAADRKRLRQEFSETPWARRLGAEERAKPR